MADNKQIVSVKVLTPNGEKTYQVGKSEFVFGRGTKADVIVNDAGISREHLKIKIEAGQLYLMDIKSLNGTFVNNQRMRVGEYLPIVNNSAITFGKSQTKIIVSALTGQNNIEHTPEAPKGMAKELIEANVPGFAKTDEDFKHSFKDAGVPEPKPRSVSAQARALIEEANFQKKSIIQNAEVEKLNLINEAKILSKKAQDQALDKYQKMVDELLSQTKFELNKLRIETESDLDAKRLKANEEIKSLWAAHEEQLEEDRKNRLLEIEKENQIKLELQLEKVKTDNQVERNKLLDAASVEIEKQKSEFAFQITKFEDRLKNVTNQISENTEIFEKSKANREEAEMQLVEVSNKLSEIQITFDNLSARSAEVKSEAESIESRITELNKNESELIQGIKNFENDRESLKSSINALSEKKLDLQNEIETLTTNVRDAKAKAKAEIETEYANLKASESQKFTDYKAHELKELQKVRDSHAEAIRSMSIELSQEITTKLELLASKSGYSQFSFDKNFQIINSTIEFKNTVNTGDEASNIQSLENWKNRKRKEDTKLLATGFSAAIVIFYIFNFAYEKIKVDPAKQEMQRLAKENERANQANKYVPVKTDQYHDNYVESVIYTDNFYEAYTDSRNQRDWVNYATKYFLRQWRVEEEKVIQVISNSNALVQSVFEEVPKLKKSKIKADLVRLKELEDGYVQQQSDILGTNVKYEAYKKIEKEFFTSRIKNRIPASK